MSAGVMKMVARNDSLLTIYKIKPGTLYFLGLINFNDWEWIDCGAAVQNKPQPQQDHVFQSRKTAMIQRASFQI